MQKNFEDISCIFCGEKNDCRDTACISCKMPLDIGKEFLEKTINNYILKEYKARGFYGLTYKAIDNYKKEFAIKLISASSYSKYGKDFNREAAMYANLPTTPSIVNYVGAGETTLSYQNNPLRFFYIVCEWVNGPVFKDFITMQNVEPEDLIIAARDLLLGLQDLYDNNLWHNDLHDENVMIEPLSQTQIRRFNRSIPRIYRIIDVGSMVYRNPADVKSFTDMNCVGNILFQISEKLKMNFSEYSKEDQYFINLLDGTFIQMMDEHPGRSFVTPVDALNQIEKYYEISRIGEIPPSKKLDSPYGYINANDIPSPWLLKQMFSDKLPYFSRIMSTSDQCLLITGPRGCGKTMILKYMRFITMYDSQEKSKKDFLKNLTYIGLFVSARTNFGNYLVSYRPQEWISDESKILLYFNILVSIELIDVLYRLVLDGLIKEQQIKPIIDMLSERFSVPFVNLLTVKTKLVQISRHLIANKDVVITIDNSTPAYLNDLFQVFRTVIPIIRGKEIIILIDDLSLPRIPVEIQRSIIPSVFNTGASYKTRITAHSEGIIFKDHAGEVYKANRDFTQINLGYEYWQLSDEYEACRDSFDDILNKRFNLAKKEDFIGLEKMLDRGDKLENIGREIYRLYQEKKLETLNYHGAKVLIKLCSGDLSYLLEILGKMELRANGKTPIPIRMQNSVIRNYARNELRSLQDIRSEYKKCSLYDIAYYFGVWSKSQLTKKNEDYIRIEFPMQKLPEELKVVARELLCYGVFIDGGSSTMSDGQTARKFLFRRIFTPAFPTTFNDHSTYPMVPASFKKFIENPKDFVRERMSAYKISPPEQQELEQLDIIYEENGEPNGTL